MTPVNWCALDLSDDHRPEKLTVTLFFDKKLPQTQLSTIFTVHIVEFFSK